MKGIQVVFLLASLGWIAAPGWVRAQVVPHDEFDAPAVDAMAASSERASGLSDPLESPPDDVVDPPEAVEEQSSPWRGPAVEFAYAGYGLADGHNGGTVHAFQFGGFIPLGGLRLGARAEFGSREYRLGQDDLLAKGTVTIGYQEVSRLGRFAPYAAAIGTLGVLVGNRFHTPTSEVFRGLGVEFGANLRLVRTLYLGGGVAYQRVLMGGFTYNLWVFRAVLGL